MRNPSFFMTTGANTFSKEERLCSSKIIDRLFSEGNRQISAFPIRLVWLLSDDIEGVQILISAPKRNFHHAVDRNRIKRQVREAYRHTKQPLFDAIADDETLLIAFIWISDRQATSATVARQVERLVGRIAETI